MYIKQAIIVEGKYDKIKLSSLVDTLIVQTDGFAIYKDKEKQAFIRSLAEKRGVILLTDSDAAGFQIRAFLAGLLPKEQVIHVYIPDVYGKEKRKVERSSEGKLGVEGITLTQIKTAFQKAGIELGRQKEKRDGQITNIDLYSDGLIGKENSKELRSKLTAMLDLPTRISTKSLIQSMNIFLEYDEYKELMELLQSDSK